MLFNHNLTLSTILITRLRAWMIATSMTLYTRLTARDCIVYLIGVAFGIAHMATLQRSGQKLLA